MPEALTKSVISALSDPGFTGTMNFDFKTYKIRYSHYKSLAGEIKSGKIKVKNRSEALGIFSGMRSPKVGAEYHADENMLILKDGFDVNKDEDFALLIHESTHAIVDLMIIGSVPLGDSEALAYLAEALIFQTHGMPFRNTGDASVPVFVESDLLAKKMCGTTVFDYRDASKNPTMQVSPNDANKLSGIAASDYKRMRGKSEDFVSDG